MEFTARATTALLVEQVRIGALALSGELAVPAHAAALVLMFDGESHAGEAVGQVESRLGSRSAAVAEWFHLHRLATLRLNLRAAVDSADSRHALSIHQSGERLAQALEWADIHADLADLRVGLFGIAMGAATMLVAAADRPATVAAVVCLGGRPELAVDSLPRVMAPTLLIAGAQDAATLELNRAALRLLRCTKRLEALPGTGREFGEPEALESAAELAAAWFEKHLARRWGA